MLNNQYQGEKKNLVLVIDYETLSNTKRILLKKFSFSYHEIIQRPTKFFCASPQININATLC